MIILHLTGGLGNQMFQYALGRRLAIERNVQLVLDTSWFETQDKRKFELDQFDIQGIIADSKLQSYNNLIMKNPLFNKKFNFIHKRLPIKLQYKIRERTPGAFDESILGVSKHCFLWGYWQSEKYFLPIADIIRKDFMPKSPLSQSDQELADRMQSDTNSVCVHVRRGDYIDDYDTMSKHYICTPDYYRQAVDFLKSRLPDAPKIYLFTDDLEWCLEEFGEEWKNLIPVSDEARPTSHELYLMSFAHHHIIPNSSFGWWGAWLCEHTDQTVVAPKKWLYNHPAPDIVPPSWIKFQHDNQNDWKYIDIPYAKNRFQAKFDQPLDLENPKSFPEKLQWLKIYNRVPLYTKLSDKFAVREYIETKVGSEYLAELYGVYENADEINWHDLPIRFVLKANHGCGWNIFCKNKFLINRNKTCRMLNTWLSKNYYYYGREWNYRDIPPKIICEEYLENKKTFGILDYKFYCFNGKPTFIYVIRYLDYGYNWAFFDLEWQRQPFGFSRYRPIKGNIKKPEKLEEMIEVARKLSEQFDFVRVDLYFNQKRIVTGELTFFPAAGFSKLKPEKYNLYLGSLLDLKR